MEATQHKEKYLINWIGGKRLLRKTIAPLIPPAENYVEPFGGGAWLLFYKDKWAKCEVYNDLDARLYNLFNVVKYHPEALLKSSSFPYTPGIYLTVRSRIRGLPIFKKPPCFTMS